MNNLFLTSLFIGGLFIFYNSNAVGQDADVLTALHQEINRVQATYQQGDYNVFIGIKLFRKRDRLLFLNKIRRRSWLFFTSRNMMLLEGYEESTGELLGVVSNYRSTYYYGYHKNRKDRFVEVVKRVWFFDPWFYRRFRRRYGFEPQIVKDVKKKEIGYFKGKRGGITPPYYFVLAKINRPKSSDRVIEVTTFEEYTPD